MCVYWKDFLDKSVSLCNPVSKFEKYNLNLIFKYSGKELIELVDKACVELNIFMYYYFLNERDFELELTKKYESLKIELRLV